MDARTKPRIPRTTALAALITAARTDADRTMTEEATVLGVNAWAVSSWERGRSIPQNRQVDRLAVEHPAFATAIRDAVQSARADRTRDQRRETSSRRPEGAST